MKKIHMIAALLAMLMPTVLWAGGSSTTYYAALKAQVSSNSSGMGKVYAGTSNSAPSASSYNASSSQTSAQESETQNSTKDLYAFALPNDGYEFVGWSRSNNGTDLGKGTAVGDAYRITAKVTFNSESSPNAQTWYATFKEKVLDAFSITFETSANGTYTVDGSAPANKTGLTKATSVVLASSDSNFLNWNINGTVVNNNPYTLRCTANTTVSADFLTADQVTSVTTLSDLTSALSNAAYKKIIVPSGTSITVAKGSTVTVPAGKQLVIDGTLVVVGTVSNSGVISGSGTLYKISYLIDQGELQILYQADGTECSTISGTAHHAGESAHYYKTQAASNTPSVSGGTISVSSKWGVLLNGETPYEISAQSVNGVRVNIDKTVAANKITSITGSLTSTDIQSGETGNSANWVLFSNCNLKGPARSGETNRLNFNGTIDLCGYTLTFGLARTYSDFYGVFLNGKINFTPSTDFQNGGSIFFNCSSINITKIKGTPTMLFYDCGTAASPATLSFSYQSSAHRNARFYCGYYSYSFNSSYDTSYATVYGGAYTSDPSDYRADKNTLTVSQETLGGRSYYVVNKVVEPAETVVKIGTTEYDTLKKAIAAAQNGDTISCIAAVDLTGTEIEIPSGKSITISLDEYKISGGKIINRGTLLFTDRTTGTGKAPSDVSGGMVESDIDNYGTLDFVFGSYSGSIVNKSGGTLTTHNGMFTGTLTKEAGTVNLKGGHFTIDVTALATVAGCEVFNRNSLYSVCEVPNGTMYDTTVKEKAGYGATPYATADHTLLKTRYNNEQSGRTNYSERDWKRLAELMAFYQLFNNNGLDPTLVFDRAVAQDSVNLSAATGSNEIDSELFLAVPAGTPYRALTEKLIRTINPLTGKTSYAKTYHAIIEENLTSVAIAVTDKSGNNAGTLCKAMVELWDSYKTNSTLKATNTVYDAGHKFFVLNAGSNKAMIRPATGATTFYSTLAGAMDAVADGGTVMLANDCDTALPLNKAGTYTFDTMGFAHSDEYLLGEGLVLQSVTDVDSSAKVLVADAVAKKYVVARKIAVPTAVSDLVYDSTAKTGVAAGTGYTLSGNTATAAGSYTATATLDANYVWADESTVTKTIKWSIAPAPLTVTVTAVSKTYGQTDPKLTYTVEGLLGEDSMSGELARAVGEDVGTYAINQGTLTAGSNYAITYMGANFTIAPPDSVAKVDIDHVPDAWMEANGFDSNSSAAEVQTELCKNDGNGIAKWENVVMGQNGATPPAIETSTNGTATVADIVVSFTPPSDIGYTVKYVFDEVDVANGDKVLKEGTIQNKPQLDLTKVAAAGEPHYFKMRTVLESTDHAITSEVAVEHDIGVLKVESSTTNTILAVPWKSFHDTDVNVSELVHAASLSENDMLSAYDESGNVKSWYVKNGVWASATDVSVSGEQQTVGAKVDPTTFYIARGKGVWLKRSDTSKPIYLMGMPTSDPATNTLAAATDAKTPSWNLLASPKFETVNIATGAFKDNTGDEIIVPTAGTPKHYTYKSNAWGYPGATTTVEKTLPNGTKVTVIKTEHKTNDTTVAPGTGFWYLNKGGEKTIRW